MHSAVVILLYAAFALCCCSIPPIYMRDDDSKQLFVGVAVALTAIVGTAVHYATVSLPLTKLKQSIDGCLAHYHETENRIELATNQKNLALLTSKCADRTPLLLAEFQVNSFIDELCCAQASAKDVCETLFATVSLKAKLRAEGLSSSLPPASIPLASPGRGNSPLRQQARVSATRQLELSPVVPRNTANNYRAPVAHGSEDDVFGGSIAQPPHTSLQATQEGRRHVGGYPSPLSATPEDIRTEESQGTASGASLIGGHNATQPRMDAPRRHSSVYSIPKLASPVKGSVSAAMPSPVQSSLGSTPVAAVALQNSAIPMALAVPAAAEAAAGAVLSAKRLRLARGSRFQGDKPNIFLYVERSLNKNIVVYESPIEQADGRSGAARVGLSLTEPVRAYWLDIDPTYVEKRRKKGILTDVEELNFIEKKMAYGITATLEVAEGAGGRLGSPLSSSMTLRQPSRHMLVPSQSAMVHGEISFTLDFAALPTRGMRLVLLEVLMFTTAQEESGQVAVVPVVECIVDGKRCVLERVYVATSTSAFRTSPEYVDLFGLSVEENSFGLAASERVTY